MNNEVIDVNIYKYKCINIEFSKWIKLRGILIGFFGRTSTLKIFCQKNKIEYPVDPKVMHALPAKYLIEHSEIIYVAKIRDKIILGLHENYVNKQQELDRLIGAKEAEITKDKEVLVSEKKHLESYKKKLTTEKDSMGKIYLQSQVATTEAAIRNVDSRIKTEEANLMALVKMKKENIESWKKQIEIALASEETQDSEFVRNLTNKITKKLGYKEYKYVTPDMSETVKKIKNGEYNVA